VIASSLKSMIPMEVVDSEGTVSSDITKVLDQWKSEYSKVT